VIKVYWVTLVFKVVIRFIKPRSPLRRGLDFATQGDIVFGNIVFGKDGMEGTLGDASAAINAGFRIDIKCRPFLLRYARYDTLDRAYGDAASFSNA